MGLLSFLGKFFGGTKKAGRDTTPRPKSRYDAATTGSQNRNHFILADDLSANAAHDPETRRVLRRRSRNERDNDPHLDGLVKQLADDLVGTGPRLQLNLGPTNDDAARLVERSFSDWCRAIDFASDLRVMHEARPTDGESFGLMVSNPVIPNPVKLDLQVVETDQVETPTFTIDPNAVSGIAFDQYGNPASYHVLKQHPGDSGYWNWVGDYDTVPARFVVHWYRPRRAKQARGVSEVSSSLQVIAQARRFALATLSQQEFAASISGVLETESLPPPDGAGVSAQPVEEWQEVPFTANTLLTLPGGVTAKGFEGVKPGTDYGQYMDRQHGTAGRPLRAPLNLVTGNSSSFNFASGRLDHLPYQSMVWIERDDLRKRVIDKVFLAWVAEAQLVGLIPDGLPAVNEWTWDWHWDAFPQLDPLKEVNAAEKRLALHLTTLSEECAAEGKDWREVLKQRAAEREYMRELGLLDETPRPSRPTQQTDPEDDPVEDPTDAV